MSLVMDERVGHDGRRPSPFSWRICYALARKGVSVEFRLVRFADVETIRALSGQHMVPILCGGDRVIHDSWNIACYLEDRFPDPSLFGGEALRRLRIVFDVPIRPARLFGRLRRRGHRAAPLARRAGAGV